MRIPALLADFVLKLNPVVGWFVRGFNRNVEASPRVASHRGGKLEVSCL